MQRIERADHGSPPRALPRLTPSVLLDLAIYQIGLGLLAGVAFPFVVMAFGVSSQRALSATFIAATVGAGFLVGAANFITGRGVVGVRIQMLSDRMQVVGEMVDASTQTAHWTDLDAESLAIPVVSDDMIGSSVEAFNRLTSALSRSWSLESTIRDLLETMSQERELHALCELALTRLLGPMRCAGGALVVQDGDGLHVTARELPIDHDDLRARREVRHAVDGGSSAELELDGERYVCLAAGEDGRSGACLILPRAVADREVRLVSLFLRAFAVAAQNAVIHRRMRHLAHVDALTDLANRRAGLDRLASELTAAQRDGRPLSVVMIDLDLFKEVNDRHGHLAGDRVLVAAADALRDALRDGDGSLRFGGEEFLVVLPGCGGEAAAEIAERIRGTIVRRTAEIGIPTTASLGWASCRAQETVDGLLERADEALYRAKAAGRNGIVAASTAPTVASCGAA